MDQQTTARQQRMGYVLCEVLLAMSLLGWAVPPWLHVLREQHVVQKRSVHAWVRMQWLHTWSVWVQLQASGAVPLGWNVLSQAWRSVLAQQPSATFQWSCVRRTFPRPSGVSTFRCDGQWNLGSVHKSVVIHGRWCPPRGRCDRGACSQGYALWEVGLACALGAWLMLGSMSLGQHTVAVCQRSHWVYHDLMAQSTWLAWLEHRSDVAAMGEVHVASRQHLPRWVHDHGDVFSDAVVKRRWLPQHHRWTRWKACYLVRGARVRQTGKWVCQLEGGHRVPMGWGLQRVSMASLRSRTKQKAPWGRRSYRVLGWRWGYQMAQRGLANLTGPRHVLVRQRGQWWLANGEARGFVLVWVTSLLGMVSVWLRVGFEDMDGCRALLHVAGWMGK